MSYPSPTINTNNTAPVNLDRFIEGLRSFLETNITWLNKFFGRAYEFKEVDAEGKVLRVPKCYLSKGEYYNVLPNDSFEKGYLFFALKGNETYSDYDPISGSTKEATLSIIAWFDLKRIDDTKDYIFTEELKQDLEYYINQSGLVIEIIEWCDERAENVFQGYDLKGIDITMLMYPKAGIRVNVRVNYLEDCYS